MNRARLIVVLDTAPSPESRQAFTDLCQRLADIKELTLACGLVRDVTLALTCKFPRVIYNAFEFFDIADPAIYQMARFHEVYLLAGGAVWQQAGPLDTATAKAIPELPAPLPAPGSEILSSKGKR
jgi:hypothetical protein